MKLFQKEGFQIVNFNHQIFSFIMKKTLLTFLPFYFLDFKSLKWHKKNLVLVIIDKESKDFNYLKNKMK